MTALMRGPLVYCFEGTDNDDVRSIRIDRSQKPFAGEFEPDLLGGTIQLTAKAFRAEDCDDLYSCEAENLLRVMQSLSPITHGAIAARTI